MRVPSNLFGVSQLLLLKGDLVKHQTYIEHVLCEVQGWTAVRTQVSPRYTICLRARAIGRW